MLTYKERYDAIAKVQNLLLTGPEAVCVLDAKLEIRQHNQLASLLLGYRGRKLTGQHLSGILYDDTMIRNLLASISNSGWFQGECTLRTSSNLPLAVKCRVADYEDFPPLTRRSEIRGATRQPEHKKDT